MLRKGLPNRRRQVRSPCLRIAFFQRVVRFRDITGEHTGCVVLCEELYTWVCQAVLKEVDFCVPELDFRIIEPE